MDTATRTKIAEKIRSRPELKDYEIAKLMKRHGVLSPDVAAVRAGGNVDAAEAAEEKPASIRVRSLTEFRRAHDIPQKIRERLANLRRDGYVTEEELRQLCEVPVQNWRRHAELPEFSTNKFKLDGVTYWAAPETIRAMKQITGRA
jgi:hypothetical protein